MFRLLSSEDMFWLKLGVFFSLGWPVTAEFGKLLLLRQPGPGPADRSLRISAAVRPSTYSLELDGSYGGGQVRTRRMGQQQYGAFRPQESSQQKAAASSSNNNNKPSG